MTDRLSAEEIVSALRNLDGWEAMQEREAIQKTFKWITTRNGSMSITVSMSLLPLMTSMG